MIVFNKKRLTSICQQARIKRLYAVGSSVRDDHNENSDIDLMVVFQSTEGLDQYFNAKKSFEKEFGKKVDLIEESAVKNSIITKTFNTDKMLLYEA